MWFDRGAWPAWVAWGALTSLLAAALLLVATGTAWPYLKAGPNVMPGVHGVLQGVIAPLDGGGGFGSPAAAYSFRQLRSAYTGPGIKLRRTTGGTLDINFLGFTGFTGAPLDTAAAAAFCAATTCFLDTWYDQSANARHLTQAVLADQPAYAADCGNGKPCAQTTATKHVILTGGYTPVSGKGTFNVVAKVNAATTCNMLDAGVQFFGSNGSGNTWPLWNGSAGLNGVAADGAWHAGIGIIAGAASVVNIDGTETTGTLAQVASAGSLYVGYANSSGVPCNIAEAVYWDNYGLTAGERAALVANQKSFWGTL